MASANVLNYFTAFTDGTGTANGCTLGGKRHHRMGCVADQHGIPAVLPAALARLIERPQVFTCDSLQRRRIASRPLLFKAPGTFR